MSVYIKGFPTPNNCGACPLRLAWCRERIYMVTRPERCPLVPVPPHGDLIDKHTLIDGILYELGASEAIGDREEYAHWERVLTYVRKAPTIIPADKEGEG